VPSNDLSNLRSSAPPKPSQAAESSVCSELSVGIAHEPVNPLAFMQNFKPT
jgi:hypothetical protein